MSETLAPEPKSATAPDATAARPLRVAVIGAGVVGGATALGLVEDAKRAPADRRLAALQLAAIADRFPDAVAAKGLPKALVTTDTPALLVDPAIDVVVETIGGDEPARTFIATALEQGKAVVTANKHVIAHHGPELEALVRAHAAAGARLRFEAAVGGGIPVLGPLAGDLAANRILEFRGIVNGTTNYILSAMARDGADYGATLAEAQRLGYAEADPTGDVEGADAVNKCVILARLAFGTWFDPAEVPVAVPTLDPSAPARRGITVVDAEAIAGAQALGFALKLIARGRRLPDGSIEASVLPTALPLDDPMARVSGVTNRIELAGEPIGFVGFAGPGAGGPATSSAVLGDLLALARGAGSTWSALPPAATAAAGTLRSPVAETSVGEWLAVVAVDPAIDRIAHDTGVRAVPLHGGIALHFSERSLAAVRAHLAQEDAPPATPIYPVGVER